MKKANYHQVLKNNGSVGCPFDKNGRHIYRLVELKTNGFIKVYWQCQCGKNA